MATYTTRLLDYPHPPGVRPAYSFVPASANPKTRNIVKRRQLPRQNYDIIAWYWRCVARWAGREWHKLSPTDKTSWTSPIFQTRGPIGDPVEYNFISANLYNWYWHEPFQKNQTDAATPSLILNLFLTATAAGSGISLEWEQEIEPPGEAHLWGLLILRHPTTVTIDQRDQLLTIVPRSTTGHQTFFDARPLPGVNHYRVNSFQDNRSYNVSSNDAYATAP